MKQLETKPVLLARPLQQLTRVEQERTDPLARFRFVRLEQQHYARLQDTVEFDPVLERAAHFEPIGEYDYALVTHYCQDVVGDATFLGFVVFFLFLK